MTDTGSGRGTPNRDRNLPPLQAPAGVTALAGQVLRLDGEPLANVTLQYGARLATSDATGRFLLTDIPDGYHSLLMQGHTANAPGKTYGTFEYGVPIEATKTNVLPFTTWMPLPDTYNAQSAMSGCGEAWANPDLRSQVLDDEGSPIDPPRIIPFHVVLVSSESTDPASRNWIHPVFEWNPEDIRPESSGAM